MRTFILFLILLILSPVTARGENRLTLEGQNLVFGNASIAPHTAKTFSIALKSQDLKTQLFLRLRAHLTGLGEAGTHGSLEILINGALLDGKHAPQGLPLSYTMPNHPRWKGPFLFFEPGQSAWTLFYDDDPHPPAKSMRYFVPEVKEYLYLFPVRALVKTGLNTIRLRNLNSRASIRVLSEKTYRATDRQAPSTSEAPHDRILPTQWKFPRTTRDRFWEMHALLEKIRNPDGSWGKGYSDWAGLSAKRGVTQPLIRFVGYPVLAYLLADSAQPTPLFRERAKSGLEYLLTAQDPTGAFRWYWVQEGRLGSDALYSTGIAGRALIAGYQAFGDKRYLAASAKAVKWEMEMPLSPNANYNMFAVWHLAAHFRVTKEKPVLGAGVNKTLEVLKGQASDGAWSDAHNRTMWYHGIILRGLVELLSVMPKNHDRRERIQQGTMRAVNHVVRQQLPDGSLRLNPEKGGMYNGSLVTPAIIDAQRLLGWKLDGVIRGLAACSFGIDPDRSETWKSTLDDLSLHAASCWAWSKRKAGK